MLSLLVLFYFWPVSKPPQIPEAWTPYCVTAKTVQFHDAYDYVLHEHFIRRIDKENTIACLGPDGWVMLHKVKP